MSKKTIQYKQTVLGYKRFVGVLSQASTDAPEIIGTPYVNDVGLVNGDFSYLSDGQYLISKTGIGIGFKNQCGVLGTFNILSAVAYYQLSRVDDDSILLNTYYNEYDSMASPPLMVISFDRLINNNLIEIRFPAL